MSSVRVRRGGGGMRDSGRGGGVVTTTSSRKRYAAAVEKGESAWRREWGGFISGLTLKRLRDGNTVAVLKSSANLEQQRDAKKHAHDDDDGSSSNSSGDDDDASKRSDGGSSASGNNSSSDDATPAATFAYLFSSPAERKAARQQQLQRQRAQQQQQQAAGPSKHQQAVLEAERRGLQLASMTRKQKREFLRLTRNAAEEQAAAQHAQGRKLHELMDARVAWYQQGPYPVDLIAERLVARKAEKTGRRLQLRYNYHLPHPSWLARRAQRRREAVLAGLGRRFVFDDDGVAYDALHHRPVDLAHASLLLHEPLQQPQQPQPHSDDDDNNTQQEHATASPCAAATAEAMPAYAAHEGATRNTHTAVLVDPRRVRSTYVRAVAANRAAAVAIQQANLSTHFLSANLVHTPHTAATHDVGAVAPRRT